MICARFVFFMEKGYFKHRLHSGGIVDQKKKRIAKLIENDPNLLECERAVLRQHHELPHPKGRKEKKLYRKKGSMFSFVLFGLAANKHPLAPPVYLVRITM